MPYYIRILLLLLILVGFTPTAFAAEAPITEVISTSPAWDGFTNQDGTGLYHEVLREVFALYDITVRHEYGTSKRAEELVQTQEADFMTCDDRATPPLVLATTPLYVSDFHVFYKTAHIGPWRGIQTLNGREVLSQDGYYYPDNFPVPVKIRYVINGSQAVDMIALDRSDFYVDDILLIKQSISQAKEQLNMQDYTIRVIGKRKYYPMFKDTVRGRKIMALYDRGMHTLHEQGRLKPIYDRWGFQYPFEDNE